MARDIEALQLQMSADLRRFERSMAAMRQTADRRLTEVENRARQSDRNLDRIMGQAGRNMTDSFRTGLAGLAPALAAAFSADQVIRYADAYTGLINRLRTTGLEADALARVEERLYEIANRNGIAVEATATLYQRAAMARENLGATEEQLLQIVSGTSAALRLQGTSASEASGALLQLGQLLGGQKVQAQEYNSLIDQLPVVLQAVADGSDRWGGSINRLTADVRAGTVTAREFSAAMLTGFADVEARAAEAQVTVASSLQTLNNELGRFIGQTDAGLSATERMAQAILLLADNLEVLVTAGEVAVTIIGTRLVVSYGAAGIAAVRLAAFQTAMTASMTGTTRAALLATTAMGGLRTAMLFLLTNPIGIAITAIAGALALLALRGEEATTASEDLTRANTALSEATQAYTEAAQAAAQANGDEAASAREAATQARALAAERLRAARAALAQANATIALANAEARSRLDPSRERFNIRGDRPGRISQARDRELAQQVRQAEANAAASAEAIRAATEAIEGADRILSLPAAGGGGSGAGSAAGGSRGASGPSAQEIEERRRLFDLEREIERARAENNEAEVNRVQEQIDLIRLTQDYREAGYEDAAFQARAQLAAVNQATDAAEARAAAEERLQQRIEARAEAEREAARWAERTLQVDIEAARLAGDERRVTQLEREAELRRRIAEYAERFGTIVGTGLALSEQSRLDGAAAEGALRDQAESAAQGFVAILRSDNIWEEVGNRFRNAAFDGLEDLFANIFRQLQSSQGGGSGGGWVSAFLNFLGGNKYGGKRAGGGPVSPSRTYVVGENGPETFVPNQAGRIIASGTGARGGQMEVVHRVVVVPDEASFIDLADARAAPMALAAYQGARSTIPAQMRKQALRTKGRR